MNSNQHQVEPPNDVEAHIFMMEPRQDEDVDGHIMMMGPGSDTAPGQPLVHGDSRDDDVEAHVLPDDLVHIQPPRDLDIER